MSKGWIRLRLRYMFVSLFLDVKFSGHLRPVNKAVTLAMPRWIESL